MTTFYFYCPQYIRKFIFEGMSDIVHSPNNLEINIETVPCIENYCFGLQF